MKETKNGQLMSCTGIGLGSGLEQSGGAGGSSKGTRPNWRCGASRKWRTSKRRRAAEKWRQVDGILQPLPSQSHSEQNSAQGPQQMANNMVISKQPPGSSPWNRWRSHSGALDSEEDLKDWRKPSEDVDNSSVSAKNLHGSPQTIQYNSGLWGSSSETLLLGHVFCTHFGMQA